MQPPSIFIFVALACEAKPLVQHWQLKKQVQTAFTLYSNAERVVVVSGLGKIPMAASIGYCMALYPDSQNPIMFNIGIAGHGNLPVGSVVIANKIINQETGRSFYPQLHGINGINSATLSTLSKPEQDYPEDCLYDMEAAAFYEIATKFSSNELIHSLKIVSDNHQSPISNINEDLLQLWMLAGLPAIEKTLSQLENLRGLLARQNHDALIDTLTSKFHFTVSANLKLKSLLQRWQLLRPEQTLCWQDSQSKNSKEFLLWLENQIQKIEFYL